MTSPAKAMIAVSCLMLLWPVLFCLVLSAALLSAQTKDSTPHAVPVVATRAPAASDARPTSADTRALNAPPTREIVVSLQDRRLALVEDGVVTKVYRVAVGREESPSPTGTFTIVVRVENPTYYHEGQVIPPGPSNPVGTRWIGLDKKGYGIHGTNMPHSIGKAASHGCIRMGQRDLEDLFAQVRSGDAVEIVGERNDETAAIFGAPMTPAPAIAPVRTVAAQAAPEIPALDPASDAAETSMIPAIAPVNQ